MLSILQKITPYFGLIMAVASLIPLYTGNTLVAIHGMLSAVFLELAAIKDQNSKYISGLKN